MLFSRLATLKGGVANKSRRRRNRRVIGPLTEGFQVFTSNQNIDLSPYGLVEDVDLFTISNGNNGNNGNHSRGGGPSGPGGSGGQSGIVKFTPNPYGGVPGPRIAIIVLIFLILINK